MYEPAWTHFTPGKLIRAQQASTDHAKDSGSMAMGMQHILITRYHWLLKRHPVSCRIAISYDVWESQVTHSSSRSPLEAFQQNTFKESVVFVGGIEDLTFTSGVLASWVSCWRILKGMLEYQKSFPRYYVQPYLKARLQVLWRLLLILLHLDGSTIRP